MKLLIATSNPGKLEEIKHFLGDLPVELVSLRDTGITEKAEETGSTFDENAILKATFYMKLSGLPTIGDDGGLEIDALGGAPGVKSHRWIHGDRDDSDEELIQYTISQLRGVPLRRRGAQLRAVLAFVTPEGTMTTAEAATCGIIPLAPATHRTNGFPYRSLLFLPELNKFYDTHELTPEENEVYNHRKKALEKLKPYIQKYMVHGS